MSPPIDLVAGFTEGLIYGAAAILAYSLILLGVRRRR